MMTNKRICFVTIRNIFAIPCLPRYQESFGDIPFDIIYWDRKGIEEFCTAENHYSMNYPITNFSSKWKIIFGYLKFFKFTKNIMKKNNYDFVVVFQTHTAVLLNKLLRKKYKGKYIIDIRDYTAEHNKIFYKLQEKIIRNSGLTIITSPAYRNFLPKYDYLISHNIPIIPSYYVNNYRNRNRKVKSKIVISCIGNIRFYNQFIKIINYFKNDDRFMLRFIGNGSEYLKDFIEENQINNVELIGRFQPDKTIDFYMDTDIVMNLYGNNSPFLDYALSNKLYYAAILGIPILVSPNTFMEEISIGNGFGFTFDLNKKGENDRLFSYYQAINWDEFYFNCDKFMEKILKDEQLFQETLKNFFNK